MKSSPPEAGSPDRKISTRLRALMQRGRRKTHRLSANVTGEEDWEVDEPQIRMSRAFAVMLILHLVAVGGLFAFHMFGKDDRETEDTATRTAHAASPPPPAAPVRSAVAPATAPAPRAEVVEESIPATGQSAHLMGQGDSKLVIAARYGITVRELEDANPDKHFMPGESLTIPQHARVIGALADASAPVNPPIALIEPTASGDVAQQEFALKKEDNPYAPVDAADLPTVRAQVAPARATAVKAEPVTEEAETFEPEEEVVVAPPVRKAAPAPAPTPVAAKTKPATGSRSHVIQKGDTIYNVARRYGLSPNEVMRANGISDPSRLQMGKVLKITVKR